jgi:prepilin-type processing-associated H-X9-DG protein
MLCPHCGADNSEEARFCTACGAQLYSQTAAPVRTPEAQPYVPLKTSGLAIASLILGVLGFLTCGLTAIPGLILGIIAAVKISANRERLSGQGFAIAAIAVSGAAIFLIPVMAAIVFPVFARAREAARRSTCQTNMKEIAMALKIYADDWDGVLPCSALNKTSGTFADYGCKLCVNGQFPAEAGSSRDTWPQIMYDDMRNKDAMWCPSDSTSHDAFANPTVSYWYKYALDRAWRELGKRTMADLGYEADQIVFFEHRGWHYGDQSGLKQGVNINAAFADGHVERITLPCQAPPESSPVDSPSGADQPYEPFYFNTCVDPATGAETVAPGAPLDPDSKGKWYDPTRCYDKMF